MNPLQDATWEVWENLSIKLEIELKILMCHVQSQF